VKVRYQADADLNEDIVTGVCRRAPEIEFQTAYEARLSGVKDSEVLALAAREGRILVTHDRKTMPGYFGEFIKSHKSPGLFIITQNAELLLVIEELILIWSASEAEEHVNSVRALPL
jgi:predicted nuclease of predicted toxin-antitoxin system